MIVEAFVLPYLGRSAGVVFWEGRRAGQGAPAGAAPARRGGARQVEPDTLAVYAPGDVSDGEVSLLRASYVASLGQAIHDSGHAAGAAGTLFWWWAGGTVAALLLALRSLEFGPGFAWLALVAAGTALPVGVAGVAWPVRGRRAALATRLARRATRLVPAQGADGRTQERLAGLWRVAAGLEGSPVQQLRELESYCREQSWRQAARYYADQRVALEGPGGGRSRFGWGPLRRLRSWMGALSPARPAYAVAEMRAW